MVSMVNVLSAEERVRIVGCLTEGMSIRATVRVTGSAKNTIVKLLADLGKACAEYQDRTLVNLPTTYGNLYELARNLRLLPPTWRHSSVRGRHRQ